jgi:uncharacterized protein (DUF2147 family)
MKKIVLFGAFCLSLCTIQAQSLVGTWKTIDDETKEAKSHVQLYEENGKVYGKVVKFLTSSDVNRVCDKCNDWRKGQKIMQMVIVRDLKLNGDTWKGGKILDPEKGKEYTCTMWFEKGKTDELNLRGWIGPFFRTQKWYKVQ